MTQFTSDFDTDDASHVLKVDDTAEMERGLESTDVNVKLSLCLICEQGFHDSDRTSHSIMSKAKSSDVDVTI